MTSNIKIANEYGYTLHQFNKAQKQHFYECTRNDFLLIDGKLYQELETIKRGCFMVIIVKELVVFKFEEE